MCSVSHLAENECVEQRRHVQHGRFGLLGESRHDDHDMIGQIAARLQGEGPAQDEAPPTSDGHVGEGTEQQPRQQTDMTHALHKLPRPGHTDGWAGFYEVIARWLYSLVL